MTASVVCVLILQQFYYLGFTAANADLNVGTFKLHKDVAKHAETKSEVFHV